MKNKIGRNDSCECGSGLKYKKCCLLKGVSYYYKANNITTKHYTDIKIFFSQFYYIDLVSFIASTSLNPLNHGKNIRLDYLTLAALKYGSKNKGTSKELDYNLLEIYLISNYGKHYLEDPVETFFTSNICFQNGNAIVYEGIFTNGSSILQSQIDAINIFKDELGVDLVKNINQSLNFLLEVSNIISRKLNHKRNLYLEWSNISNELILNLNQYSGSQVIFDNSTIEKLYKKCKIPYTKLDEYSINIDSINEEELLIDNNNRNPLFSKPIVRTEKGLCIISPTNLVSCLVHSIWVKCINHNMINTFLLKFHYLGIVGLKRKLAQLNYKLLKEVKPEESKDVLPIYLIYEFDDEKVLVVALKYDMGEKYNIEYLFENNNVCFAKFNKEDIDNLTESFKSTFKNKSLQVFCLLSTIGRNFSIMSDIQNNSLSGSLFDIMAILNSGIESGLDLWYYNICEDQFKKQTQIIAVNSSLDKYSYFYNNKSFYLSDAPKPNILGIITDGNFEVIKHGKLKKDRINALYNSALHDRLVYLSVEKYSDYITRYFNLEIIAKRLEFYIPNWPFSLWVKSSIDNFNIQKHLKNTFWEYCEAICFWLNEIGPSINQLFENVLFKSPLVIDVYFDFEESQTHIEKNIDSLEENIDIKEIESSFTTSIIENGFTITIPTKFWQVVRFKNNSADRLLIFNILKAFKELFSKFEIELSLEQINSIVDNHAPLGLKKYLLIMSTLDNFAFDNRYLDNKLITLVSDYNYELLHDRIIQLLGDKCPPVGSIIGKSDKLNLCKNITILIANLISQYLQNYNSGELLTSLLERYEVTLHHNEVYSFRVPTLLNCYAEKWDIKSEIRNNAGINDMSTLTLRGLIEFVASENYSGNLPVTKESLDDLCSMIRQLLFYGQFHDIISFDLFETKMWILNSGRVGHNLKEIDTLFSEKFHENKVDKLIIDSVDFYYSAEENKVNFTISDQMFEKISEAFLYDFKVSYKDLKLIVDFLILYPFELKTNLVKIEKNSLSKIMFSHFSQKISLEAINSSLNLLSLKNRNGILKKLPKGYDESDVFPWKYNRRLSYLYKPIIEYIDKSNKTFLLFTPRHLEKSFTYLASKISSGQFKCEEKGQVIKVIGTISQIKGNRLQKSIVDFFSQFKSLIIKEEFKIGVDNSYQKDVDLGDIDVLLIDKAMKVIVAIESKRTEESKNMREFASEFDDYLSNGGYVFKHKRRHEWAIKNVSKIGERNNLNTHDFKIISCMITKEKLAIQFMSNKKIGLPIFTLRDFQKKTITDIYDIISGVF